MYRVITLLLVLAVCLTVAAPQAQATMITAGGTTVFYDDSENSTVGVIPALTDPSIGAWVNHSIGSPRILTLTGPDVSGDAPGAFSGDNYLVLQRTSDSHRQRWSAKFDAVDPADTALHAEFMIFVKQGASMLANVSFQKTSNYSWTSGDFLTMIMFGNPPVGSSNVGYNTSDGSGSIDTGLDFVSNDWNKVVLDWDPSVSTTTMKLTVNGSSFDAPVTATLPSEITCLTFAEQINGTRFYLDAVPEPSTLALLATGLIGLLCYAWRKRK